MLVKEIIEATGGHLLSGNPNQEIKGFTQDTRKIREGDMYIPLIGENNDGHDFIEQAFMQGASAIITSKKVVYPSKIVIEVEDTLKAMSDMAAYLREHRSVKVVGITGSVGKTSTKDMIYAVVSTQYKTLKTLGNYNNHIGLPLTILRHQDEEVMILEMGMNHLGEIHHLTTIAKPDVAAITNVGTAHIGELGSRENILKAKMEIVDGLKKDGTLVINDDNDMLHQIQEENYHLMRVGQNEDCDLKAYHVDLQLEESYFDIDYQGKTYHVHVPVSGIHFVYNALIAIGIGLTLGIDMNLCIEGVEHFELTKNRMDILELKDHIKIIDGTYNANLDSMKSSIDVLSQYKNRKIAVLADMLELGEFEKSLHEEVGKYIVEKEIDELLCVGKASEYIVDIAQTLGLKNAYHFESNQEINDYLDELLEPEDVILIKGSNGMHLKEVVEHLKERK
ncbi:MAG: UDP-N-acetylmuramoyl-tripeptide--D-alanyl-D-alanine ligase [Longibaculum sp.]